MKNLSLCIIDDSEIDRLYIQKIASQLGYFEDVTSYDSGLAAMKAIIDQKKMNLKCPDLVILDLDMPEMDGLEWIDEIEDEIEDFKPVVFILTNSLQLRDREKFEQQKTSSEFLSKPLEKDSFNALLEKYFG